MKNKPSKSIEAYIDNCYHSFNRLAYNNLTGQVPGREYFYRNSTP